jgi:hypothetical protein
MVRRVMSVEAELVEMCRSNLERLLSLLNVVEALVREWASGVEASMDREWYPKPRDPSSAIICRWSSSEVASEGERSRPEDSLKLEASDALRTPSDC